MTSFTPARQQDAYAAFAGFHYQMQVTLLRWLALSPNETLHLECGEDIDSVLHAADQSAARRTLEQVKVRKGRLTLRSPEALTALAHFAAHLEANRGLDIRYRYTTTAVMGQERRSPLGSARPAIAAWQDLQSSGSATTDTLQGLRTIIAQSSQPVGCQSDAWASLQAIVQDAGVIAFAEFVSRFEWSLASSRAHDLAASLRESLSGREGGTASAVSRYEQLMIGLLEILSQPGLKTLTYESLSDALARPTLTAHDRARLDLLELRLVGHDEAIAEIKDALSTFSSSGLPGILFGPASTSLSAVSPALRLPAAPPLVSRLARRSATISRVAARNVDASWIHVSGDYGTGKTHFAVLLAQHDKGVALGLSLRDIEATSLVPAFLNLTTHGDFAAIIAAGGCVFIDSLPDYAVADRLGMATTTFVNAIIDAGGTVISTGRLRLPPGTDGVIHGTVADEIIPPFEDSDVAELLAAHGIAEPMSPGDLSTITLACGGHPMLITAVVRDIAKHGAHTGGSLLGGLLTRTHWTELDLSTARTVAGTVEGDDCRRLLYRLAAIRIPLSDSELRLVADLPPRVPETTVCLAALEGLWLRRDGDNRFSASPLTIPLARDIPLEEQRAVHSATARAVFSRATLSPITFLQAVVENVLAGETELAAMHLIIGCMRWPHPTQDYSVLGVLWLFRPDDDHGLPPHVEVPLRAFQLAAAVGEGEPTGPYLRRLATRASEVTEDGALGAMLAASVLLGGKREMPLDVSVAAARLVERWWASASVRGLTDTLEGNPFEDGAYLLSIAAHIQSWTDLSSVIELLGEVRVTRGYDVCEHSAVRPHLMGFIYKPLFDATGARTDDALGHLEALATQCRENGLQLLEAYAIAGQCSVIADTTRDVAAIKELGMQGSTRLHANPGAEAVLKVAVGQQLVWLGESGDGLTWLREGLAGDYIHGIERANRVADVMIGAWIGDPELLFASADELGVVIEDIDTVNPEVLCQWHAQLATVRWQQRRDAISAEHFETAVANLLDMPDSPRRRHLGAWLVHSLLFCESVARGGTPPEYGNGEPFATPSPDMFSGISREVASKWRVRQGPAMLQLAMARLFEALRLEDSAAMWFERASQAAIDSRAAALVVQLGARPIAASIRKMNWVGAVEGALAIGRARVFVEALQAAGRSSLDDDESFDASVPPSQSTDEVRALMTSAMAFSRALVVEMAPDIVSGAHRGELGGSGADLARVAEEIECGEQLETLLRIASSCLSEEMTPDDIRSVLATTDDDGSLVAHGMLGLRPDVRLEQATASQVGVLYRLYALREALGLDADRYATAVCAYWDAAVRRERFRFSRPRDVESELESVRGLPILERAKRVLITVITSLSVRPDPAYWKWLTEGN